MENDARYLSKDEKEYRLNLYHQGLDDNQIAQKIGITHCGVQIWRKRNSLSAIRNGSHW